MINFVISTLLTATYGFNISLLRTAKRVCMNSCSRSNWSNSIIYFEIPIKDGVKSDFDEIIYMQNSGIDLTDKTDSFFNDICVPFEKGMSFQDRKSLYINITFCDKECDRNPFLLKRIKEKNMLKKLNQKEKHIL